jgi:hypothetical protein
MIRTLCVALVCLLAAACASAPQSQKVALPTAPRPGEPAGIAGLSAADVRANFGIPAFVRKDGVAELWRYDGQGCKAFFFLYPEGGSNRVRHVETLPRANGATAADPACLQLLLKRRATQPVS